MKKHIILLSAAGLLFSSCGVYTKYKPATEVPDGLYGEEIATFTESTDGSPVAPEDSLDLGLAAWSSTMSISRTLTMIPLRNTSSPFPNRAAENSSPKECAIPVRSIRFHRERAA